MLPRLVAVDLDGTLLRRDGSISEPTRHALRACRDAGIAVLPVTARAPEHVVPVVAGLSWPGDEAICCLGAVVWHLGRRKTVDTTPFPAGTVDDVVAAVRAVEPAATLRWRDADGPGQEPGYPVAPPAGCRIGTPGGETVVHVSVRRPDRARLDPRIPGAVGALAQTCPADDGTLLDLTAPGVNKVTSLQRWCRRRGIAARQVVAIGDSVADVAMLRWAGLGVAVANAEPAVRSAASLVVPENDAEGVATFLTGLLGTERRQRRSLIRSDR